MIQRVLSAFLGVLLLIAAFVFASIMVAIALTIGMLLAAWIWWRSRSRRATVIEGEYRIIDSR